MSATNDPASNARLKLNASQKAKLMLWLVHRSGDGTLAPMTLNQIIEQASKDLGFRVAEATTRHYLDECGFAFTKRIAPPRPPSAADLIAEVEALKTANASLRAEVEAAVNLMQTLGTGLTASRTRTRKPCPT